MSQNMEEVLATSVSSLPDSKKSVITVSTDDDFSIGFRRLLDQGLTSAPVVNPGTQEIPGFLDLRDLVSVLVNVSKVCHIY